MSEHEEEVGLLIKHIHNLVKNEINKELSKFDLTCVQEEVLNFLSQNNDKVIYQKDIEAYLKLRNPTVTGIVKRLEDKGMINRFPGESDGRCKRHVLTEKGDGMVKHVMDHGINHIEKKLLKNFTYEEKNEIIKLLKKALKNMEE